MKTKLELKLEILELQKQEIKDKMIRLKDQFDNISKKQDRLIEQSQKEQRVLTKSQKSELKELNSFS